jgi:CBS domain-containing protein
MVPCTITLRHDECVGEAVALLRETGMSALPVVDDDGRFVGLVDDELDRQPDLLESYSPRPIRSVMKTDCVQLPENTSFETLLDFFARDRRSHILIEQGGKPTGFVSRRSLARLSGTKTATPVATAAGR